MLVTRNWQPRCDALLQEGIYVMAFRTQSSLKALLESAQMSAAHDQSHLDRAVDAFTRVGRRLGVIA